MAISVDLEFSDLHLDLTDSPDGCGIGNFEGTFCAESPGHVVSINFAGYKARKLVWHRVSVPCSRKPDSELSRHESFIRECANQLEAEYDIKIKEAIARETALSRFPEYEAAE